MLELTCYSIQNIDDLKDLFTICYTIIDDIYKEIEPSQITNRKTFYKVSFVSFRILKL